MAELLDVCKRSEETQGRRFVDGVVELDGGLGGDGLDVLGADAGPRGDLGVGGPLEVALLGRGGAAFPVARKLESMPRSGALAVVVNGSESEPASHKDRVLMRRSPHLVLDGLRVVAASPPEDPYSPQASADGPDDVGEDSADYLLTRHTRLQAGSEVLLVGTYPDVIGAFRANEPTRV